MPSARCAGSVRPLNTTSSVNPRRRHPARIGWVTLLYALVDGITVWDRRFDARGGAEARDRVDEMLCQGLHIPVATGSGTVEVVGADRPDDIVHDDQCLFGTGEFVHGSPEGTLSAVIT